MANITNVVGEKFLVQIGNGASTEVFAHPALINSNRSFTITANAESDELTDQTAQDVVGVTVRRVRSTDSKIEGAGILHLADAKVYADWAASGAAKNIKVTVGNVGGMIVTGSYILTSFQISGERKQSVQAQMTLEQAGPITVTAGV